jgi:hypothetical protein
MSLRKILTRVFSPVPMTPNRAFLDAMRGSSLPALEGGDQVRLAARAEEEALMETGRRK